MQIKKKKLLFDLVKSSRLIVWYLNLEFFWTFFSSNNPENKRVKYMYFNVLKWKTCLISTLKKILVMYEKILINLNPEYRVSFVTRDIQYIHSLATLLGTPC